MNDSVLDCCTAWVQAVCKGRVRRTQTGRLYRVRQEDGKIEAIRRCPYCARLFYDERWLPTEAHRAHIAAVDWWDAKGGAGAAGVGT